MLCWILLDLVGFCWIFSFICSFVYLFCHFVLNEIFILLFFSLFFIFFLLLLFFLFLLFLRYFFFLSFLLLFQFYNPVLNFKTPTQSRRIWSSISAQLFIIISTITRTAEKKPAVKLLFYCWQSFTFWLFNLSDFCATYCTV